MDTQGATQSISSMIVPILIALVAALPGILAYFKGRNVERAQSESIKASGDKADAEATSVLVVSAVSLLEPMRQRVDLLEVRDREKTNELDKITKRLSKVEHSNYILCNGVRRLIHQIRSLGATPVFEMSDDLCEELGSIDYDEVALP